MSSGYSASDGVDDGFHDRNDLYEDNPSLRADGDADAAPRPCNEGISAHHPDIDHDHAIVCWRTPLITIKDLSGLFVLAVIPTSFLERSGTDIGGYIYKVLKMMYRRLGGVSLVAEEKMGEAIPWSEAEGAVAPKAGSYVLHGAGERPPLGSGAIALT